MRYSNLLTMIQYVLFLPTFLCKDNDFLPTFWVFIIKNKRGVYCSREYLCLLPEAGTSLFPEAGIFYRINLRQITEKYYSKLPNVR